MSEIWYEERPCPSDACGGQVRRFKVETLSSGSGKLVARVAHCTECGHIPRQVTGSAHPTVEARFSVSGEAITPPQSAAEETARIEEFGYHVTWQRSQDDGLLLVFVHDQDGNLVDAGGGDDAVDLILGVAERLLPPD